ncbi:hypothetical protein NKDENANG_03023 [Candidatus Entotheonellaceae bacterium PAL068K]
MVQKLQMNGQPRPASKRPRVPLTASVAYRQKRGRLPLQARQIVHEVVDRHQAPVVGRLVEFAEVPFGLTDKQGHPVSRTWLSASGMSGSMARQPDRAPNSGGGYGTAGRRPGLLARLDRRFPGDRREAYINLGAAAASTSRVILGPGVTNPCRRRRGPPDAWELAHGLHPNDSDDAGLDPDGGNVVNLLEYQLNSDPTNPATPLVATVAPSRPGAGPVQTV